MTIQTGLIFRSLIVLAALLFLNPTLNCLAQDDGVRVPDEPSVAGASGDAEAQISAFSYPGLECKVFAAEPEVANIVAFHRDYQGRVYVCETFRQGKGVEDNRNHTYWMDEELQAQTVQDRVDYMVKYHDDAMEIYQKFDDRIRVLFDKDNDGKPDEVEVFANRFNRIDMGTGAGVLSYRGEVFYTCIPSLFKLVDKDGDNVADERKVMHDGFGVRFAFRGHDMHGLIVGPDGRLYFSIGDRGYNVVGDKEIKDVVSGAVFRCELDGSNLEVFATGLRNPQELAFDDFGNLFTGDNNSDSGDMARWVYLVRGGDSGWRMYYQYLTDRGPFNRENIWVADEPTAPAYIVPPIKNLSDGPSGLEYYPGTGFSDDFNGRFFLCDFRGGPSNSGIRSFRSKPKGAFFEVTDETQPIWQFLATDLDFGSDGKLYVSDWVNGWNGLDKGRLYTFPDPEKHNSGIVKEVERLLREGMKERPTEELATLLSHDDQRVRQESQLELVARDAAGELKQAALGGATTLARIHAIWGLEQLLRTEKATSDSLLADVEKLFGDKDDEVRAQAAKLAGEHFPSLKSNLESLLGDESLRVRYFATMGLARVGDANSAPAIIKMLTENADKDPIVRHGGIMAMSHLVTTLGDEKTIELFSKNENKSVRLAASVGLRKAYINAARDKQADRMALAGKMLASLLVDDDATIVLEAARAVHDLPVDGEPMELLSNLEIDKDSEDALVRRVLSACNRVGTSMSAGRLVMFATEDKLEEDRRLDALKLLKEWAKPDPRDIVLGQWRDIDPASHNVDDVKMFMQPAFEELISASPAITSAAIDTAGSLDIDGIGESLQIVVLNDSAEDSTRAAALKTLEQVKFEGLGGILKKLETGFDSLPPLLAASCSDVLSRGDAELATKLLTKVLSREITEENKSEVVVPMQKAYATIGEMKDAGSAALLTSAFEKIKAGSFTKELILDVVMAAENREEEDVQVELKAHNVSLVESGVLTDKYADTLFGGDNDAGEEVFTGKTEVSCVRCHRIDWKGGKVGPNLSAIATTKDRRYILESIVDPNKEIAEGHGQIIVMTDEGQMFTGIVSEETETELSLMDPDGNVTRIDVETIEARKAGKSSMPEELAKQLTQKELRDLVEYLANRKNLDAVEADGGTTHE
jgi:quinoprotein glucose dehydrogenase